MGATNIGLSLQQETHKGINVSRRRPAGVLILKFQYSILKEENHCVEYFAMVHRELRKGTEDAELPQWPCRKSSKSKKSP